MEELTKKQLLDKLEENGFISAEQKKGFDKLTQEELSYLLSVSETIKSLEADKTEALEKVEEQAEKIAVLEKEKAEVESQRDEAKSQLHTVLEKTRSLREKSQVDFSEKKVEPGVSFTLRSEKYKFKDTAPKKIRYDNQIFTQEELAKNQDYLIELVGGNSSLIEKI